MGSFPVDLNLVPEHVVPVVVNRLLEERIPRAPNHKAELRATTNVITALIETPDAVLQKLATAVMQVTGADSAGVSLAGRDGEVRVFLWQAAVGLFDKYLGSVVRHDESPCGSVVDADFTMLMVDPGKAFKTAVQVEPPIREALLVPFHLAGRAVGTVWAVSQSAKAFDAEDARVVQGLSKLAALSYQLMVKLGNLELLSRNVRLVVEDDAKPRKGDGGRSES